MARATLIHWKTRPDLKAKVARYYPDLSDAELARTGYFDGSRDPTNPGPPLAYSISLKNAIRSEAVRQRRVQAEHPPVYVRQPLRSTRIVKERRTEHERGQIRNKRRRLREQLMRGG